MGPDTLFHVLRTSEFLGPPQWDRYDWSLPTASEPGGWMPPVVGDLEVCRNGYHLEKGKDVLESHGDNIYTAEFRGEVNRDGYYGIVVREARLVSGCPGWTIHNAHLFACECARRVLPIWERAAPWDSRPRNAIAVAELYAAGDATDGELNQAHRAAWDAAFPNHASWAPAAFAAWAACRCATQSPHLSAAWLMAAKAAGGNESDWQFSRLCEFLAEDVPLPSVTFSVNPP